MRNNQPTRKYRYQIADLMQQGYTIQQAEDIVMKGNSNKSRDLKSYKQRGLYPYGKVDSPLETNPSSFVNDGLSIAQIKKLVDKFLEPKLKNLEDKLRCSSIRLQKRPKLKRTLDNCIPTSFRLPRELVERAREKAKVDPVGVAGLNGLVELWLFEYIGSPPDLLE